MVYAFFRLCVFAFVVWVGFVEANCLFTPQEMVLPDAKEISNQVPKPILDALERYHETQLYTQTPKQFRAAPDLYFQRRITALEALLNLLENQPKDVLLEDLEHKAQNKLAYLSEVPKKLHLDYIQRRLLRMKKQKNLAVKDSPLLNVCKSYWVELWDPLHRSGPEMELRIALWEKSCIPSFFVFLEVTEKDFQLNKEAPFVYQVRYLGAAECEKQRLEFCDGLAYLNGRLFDTATYLKEFPESHMTIYVLAETGEFYIYPHKRYVWQHSSLFQAAAVLDAGEMLFEHGVLKKISNRSGHYTPTAQTLLRSLKILAEKALNLEALEVKIFEFHPYTKELITRISYRGNHFLEGEGLAIPESTERSWKPLHVIAWNNDWERFATVCNLRHLNAHERGGNTPLHLTVLKNNLSMMKLLIVLGADPKIFNHRLETPLHIAIKYAPITLFYTLLQATPASFLYKYAGPLLIQALRSRKNEHAIMLLTHFKVENFSGSF